MTQLTGHCLCGAVQISAPIRPDHFNACYCDMCRRWTGSRFQAVGVAAQDLTVLGEDHISRRRTSDWAERANCTTCGTPLWYRMTADGAPEQYNLSLGMLDDITGMTLANEYFVDRKGSIFDPSETSKKLTEAEVIALFAPSEEGEPQ